jgi:hypothetical protein
MLPLLTLAVFAATMTAADIDYAGLYARGATFAEFVEDAGGRGSDWRRVYDTAAPADDAIARVRRQPHAWRVLVVADPACSDSISTIPHIARLVDAVPERLALRIVRSSAGRAVMEAHRTPDDRAATPTVILIREDGHVRAWVERPSALQAWFIEKRGVLARRELVAQRSRWYEEDAGRSTLAEVVGLLDGPSR